ncbi:MAG: hypothetical protein R3E87_22320 [Burkholderiaceae bacterium]
MRASDELRLCWTRDPLLLGRMAVRRYRIFRQRYGDIDYPDTPVQADVTGQTCLLLRPDEDIVGGIRLNEVDGASVGQLPLVAADGLELPPALTAEASRIARVSELGGLFVNPDNTPRDAGARLYLAAAQRCAMQGVGLVLLVAPGGNLRLYRRLAQQVGWKLRLHPEADCEALSRRKGAALALASLVPR